MLIATLFRSVLFRPDCFATYSYYMAYIEVGPGFVGAGLGGRGVGEFVDWLVAFLSCSSFSSSPPPLVMA